MAIKENGAKSARSRMHMLAQKRKHTCSLMPSSEHARLASVTRSFIASMISLKILLCWSVALRSEEGGHSR